MAFLVRIDRIEINNPVLPVGRKLSCTCTIRILLHRPVDGHGHSLSEFALILMLQDAKFIFSNFLRKEFVLQFDNKIFFSNPNTSGK